MQAFYKPSVTSHYQSTIWDQGLSAFKKQKQNKNKTYPFFLSFIPEKKEEDSGSPGIAQAGLRLSKHPRVTLTYLYSCLYFLSGAITGLVYVVLRIKPQCFVCARPMLYQLI